MKKSWGISNGQIHHHFSFIQKGICRILLGIMYIMCMYMLIKHFSAKKCKHFRRFTSKKMNRIFPSNWRKLSVRSYQLDLSKLLIIQSSKYLPQQYTHQEIAPNFANWWLILDLTFFQLNCGYTFTYNRAANVCVSYHRYDEALNKLHIVVVRAIWTEEGYLQPWCFEEAIFGGCWLSASNMRCLTLVRLLLPLLTAMTEAKIQWPQIHPYQGLTPWLIWKKINSINCHRIEVAITL